MAVRIERLWWIALLLAGALVLHLFMLTGVPQPAAHAPSHADVMAGSAALPTSAHGDSSTPHGAADMLSTCVAVLALVTAGAASVRAARSKPTGYRPQRHAGPGPQVDHPTCRAGPQVPSRVDAGVLLRV